MLAKTFLHGVSGDLRITSALPILGGHKIALGCSGLHANGCFNACQNYPAPKNLSKIALPSLTVISCYFQMTGSAINCFGGIMVVKF